MPVPLSVGEEPGLRWMKKRILVLCVGNSCRSQIAEGYLRHFGGDKAEIYSAGIETHGVNPYAVKVMKEDGVDISSHTSNLVDEYKDMEFDFVLTVCEDGNDRCPYFPAKIKNIHRGFPDPAKVEGDEPTIVKEFRNVRDMIKVFSLDFIQKNL